MKILDKGFAPALCAAIAATLLILGGCGRDDSAETGRQPTASPEETAAYEGYMTAAAEAMSQKDYEKAIRHYADARKVDDTAEVRFAISRAYTALADEAETARRRIELLEKAAEAHSTAALHDRIAQEKQRLRSQAQERYEAALARGAEATADAQWQAAIDTYEQAAMLAAEAEVDPAEARRALAEATERLDLARRFEQAVRNAETAREEKDFGAAAGAYETALMIAAEGDAVSRTQQERLARLSNDAMQRKQYENLVAAWEEAAEAEKWDEATAIIWRAQELAAEIDLPREESERLARFLGQSQAGWDRQKGAALLDQARAALEKDSLSAARDLLQQARDRLGETEAIEGFAARLRARSGELRAYLDARTRMANALEDNALAEAQRAAAQALREAVGVHPEPADLAETRDRAQQVLAWAEQRRRAALEQAEEAKQAGDLETAAARYREAAGLADEPGDAGQRLAEVEAEIALRERREREREERRKAYLAKVQEALQHETAEEYERALAVYHEARELADSPRYIDSMIEALQARAGLRAKYHRAVAHARETDKAGDSAARRSAWREAVELGRRLRPQPEDLRQNARVLLELELIERAGRQGEFNEVFGRAAEAEEKGDYDAAIELYARAAELADRPETVNERLADLKGRLAFSEAFSAAAKMRDDAPLADRLAAWKKPYDIGSKLIPRPEGFQRTARTYLSLEEARSERWERLSEQARAAAEDGRFEEAIAVLEQAAPLAPDSGAARQRIERLRVMAENTARRESYEEAMKAAGAHAAVDNMAAAAEAYEKALPFADNEAPIRKLIQEAQARGTALGPYRELRDEADAALAGDDMIASLDALSRLVARGERIDPPPRDLAKYEERLAMLREERAARYAARLEQGALLEEAGKFQDAIESYRLARKLALGDPAAIDEKIEALGLRIRERAAQERLDQYAALMASAEEALAEDRARDAIEVLAAARKLADDPAPVDEKLPEATARAEELRDYRNALDEANALLRQRLYNEALAKYATALSIGERVDPKPKDMALTEETIKAVEEERKGYALELMENGAQAWRQDLLVEALDNYRRAAALEPTNAEAAAATQRLRQEIAERDASPEYRELRASQMSALNRAVARGDRFLEDRSWDNALIAYEAALTLALQMRPRPASLPDIRARMERAKERPAPLADHENSLGMVMRRIEPGEFVMGANNGREFDGPAHRVTLVRPFYIATKPVTNQQYDRFLRATGRPAPSPVGGAVPWNEGRFRVGYEDHPVRGVSHEDAEAFCRWLSREEGNSYRLPTEAEWEYAARAGTATPYYWGGPASVEYANYKASGIDDTTPVGSYPPNGWGLYDMLGNAYEWCADRFGKYEGGPRVAPTGPALGIRRAIRGGWFRSEAEDITCSARLGEVPEKGYAWIGFRVVADAPLRSAGAN